MRELLEAQKTGNMVGDSSRLRLQDCLITRQYPLDSLPGHAAWLDWPWKLHRMEDQAGQVRWELYQLETDPQEAMDLVSMETERVERMKVGLEKWQRSVIRSLNGLDYQD